MKYQKYRELKINIFEIKFKKIKVIKILNYLPAGNDVLECLVMYNNKKTNCYIKIERSNYADFETEVRNIELLKNNYDKLPIIIETIFDNNKKIIVLEKIKGEKLSDILKKKYVNKKAYIQKYGEELAKIHKINHKLFNASYLRKINNIPSLKDYKKIDKLIKPYILYLQNNIPQIKNDTFIHGDFHYGNILWKRSKIVGVLDYEYSGQGFKEQDIAWSIILRPTQYFMDSIEDIKAFLNGYKKNGSYDYQKLKWCLINGYCHFYLMNNNNEEYKRKLLFLLDAINEEKIHIQ